MYKLMAKFVRTRKEGSTPAKVAFLVLAFLVVFILYYPFFLVFLPAKMDLGRLIEPWLAIGDCIGFFCFAPVITGLISVVILARYKRILLKVFFVFCYLLALYCLAIYVGTFKLMGISYWAELASCLLPQVLILCLYGLIFRVHYCERRKKHHDNQVKTKSVDSSKINALGKIRDQKDKDRIKQEQKAKDT